MNDEPAAEPKVTDQYWFDYSKHLITTAISKREKAAENLRKLVFWLWGIYTASSAVGLTVTDKILSPWTAVVVALASTSLIAVYWATTWIQMPNVVAFDPRSPSEIETVHNNRVTSMDNRLWVTIVLSLISAILVSLSIVMVSVGQRNRPSTSHFKASVIETVDGRTLALTGHVGTAQEATLRIRPLLNDTLVGRVISQVYLPTAEGLLQLSVPLPKVKPIVTGFDVSLQWLDTGGMTTQLSRVYEIKREADSTS